MRHIPVIVCALGLMSAALGCNCLYHESGYLRLQAGPSRLRTIQPGRANVHDGAAGKLHRRMRPIPVPTVTPVPEAPNRCPYIPRD